MPFPDKPWISLSFSLPHSCPPAPSSALPTPTALPSCASDASGQIYLEITPLNVYSHLHGQHYFFLVWKFIFFSVWLFASSHLSLCSQAWSDDSIIFPSLCTGNIPQSKRSTQTPGKVVHTLCDAATSDNPPDKRMGPGSFCDTPNPTALP